MAWRDYPAELRADMQSEYGINVDDIGGAVPLHHAATCAAMLGRSSRVARAQNPDAEWTLTDVMLSQIDYNVRMWMWAMGGGEGEEPRRLGPSSITGMEEPPDALEVAERLGIEL